MAALGALPPDHEPRATDYVDGMIAMTEALIANGHAYEADGHVLFHPHCHQKALTGTAASEAALRLVPEARVEVVDAGCCGMAGSFGFEKEHYDVSMTIGEQRLFPAIREQQGDFDVVASGISCQQQIQHGTDKHPISLAEALRDGLKVV